MSAKVEKKDIAITFAMDDEGRFLNLVIPDMDGLKGKDLTGKRQTELTAYEVSLLKVYSRELLKSQKE